MSDIWESIIKWDTDMPTIHGFGFGTPTFSSLCRCMEASKLPKDCFFVDMGSGTGNALFLLHGMFTDTIHHMLGVELQRKLHDEAIRRRELLNIPESKIDLHCQDILDVTSEYLIERAQGHPIVLFSFDPILPEIVVRHCFRLFEEIQSSEASGPKYITTWSPYFFQCSKGVQLEESIYIGAPGLEETSGAIINHSLDKRNYPAPIFEKLDDEEQHRQLQNAKRFSPETPQMDQFALYVYGGV